MLDFICYLFPAFISINIHKYLTKEDNTRNLVIYYGIYVLLNNLFSLLILFIKNYNVVLDFNLINITFLTKYLLLSTILSIITPYLVKIVTKNIEIDVEVNNEKKRKNTKNK